LARNPGLADLMLSWVVGPLQPVDDSEVEALRVERIATARRSHPVSSRSLLRRRR
jgi:CobQ-like glutamine amidotransferase family enzyme